MVHAAELVSIQRSAAMAAPGAQVSVGRETLLELCEELMQVRALLERFGRDLSTIARTARDAAT